MSYVERVIEQVKAKNAEQPEFIQAVTEVLTSLEPVIEAHPEYEAAGLLERIVEPERVVMFRVPWVDDEGKVQVNRGFRVQFNSCLGPYKGGLRLHPSVNLGIIKFLGFEQIFKNSLTTPAYGRRQGRLRLRSRRASPTPRSCVSARAFMTELCKHIGADHRRAGRRHRRGRARDRLPVRPVQAHQATVWEGVLTGKGLSYGGSLARTRGDGLRPASTSLQEYLKLPATTTSRARPCAVSGSGNVAIYATEKAAAARRQGGHPVRLHRLDPRPGGHRPGRW